MQLGNISVCLLSAVVIFFGRIVSIYFILVVGSWAYCTKLPVYISKHFCSLLKDFYSEINVAEPVSLSELC